MSKWIKVLCLMLLISICMFPASAFASSSKAASENKKSFLTNIFSVFTVQKSDSNDSQNGNSNQSTKHKVDKDWDSKGWLDWWDNDDDWWDDICWWDKNKDDSFKIWERYYCY